MLETMDDDDDYFTPTASSSRRLAMLFTPEEMTSGGSSSKTSSHSSPSTQFKFVAPKQPRAAHSSGASGDTQEVLLEVPLILLPKGTDKNGMPRVRVSCQVVGSVGQRSFSLILAAMEQAKRELWRTTVDSHLTLEVMEHSTLKVTTHTNETLTLLGDAQQIEALVTQVAICQGVASSRVTQQDLHSGRGHPLAEGDVAKVSCITYAITAALRRGEKVEEVKGVKVTVSAPTTGNWESCLAGAAADSHRLIFIPKHNNGEWQLPSQYYDVKIAKTKTGREKAVAGARSSSHPQEEQQPTLTSHDAPPTTNLASVTETRTEAVDSLENNAVEEEDGALRKAALVTRMAQVGTQIFPQLPNAKPVPQSQMKPQVAVRSRRASSEVEISPTFTSASATPTPASTNLTPATFTTTLPSNPVLLATTTITSLASTTISSSAPTTGLSTSFLPSHASNTTTSTSGIFPGPTQATHPQALAEPHDKTLAQSVGQLDSQVTKIAGMVELLLAKVERVEAKSRGEAEGSCVPETLMMLASGLVTSNERLKTQLEVAENRLVESQAAQATLVTMNTQLLEEKREMLRMEAELRKEVEDKEEELKKTVAELNTQKEMKEKKGKNRHKESEPGLTQKEVQSLVKTTLNGLFRLISSDFSEEETHYSQPHVLQTLRSGLEVAYSSFVEKLESMTGEEAEEGQVQEQDQGYEQELEQEEAEGGKREVGGQESKGGETERRHKENYERKEDINGEISSGQE